MWVRELFDAYRGRRGQVSVLDEMRLRAAEAKWAGGLHGIRHDDQSLPANPPANVSVLIAAGITSGDWDRYMVVHSSGFLGPNEYRLLDSVPEEPSWGSLLGPPTSPARMVLFHAAGITPTLLARWMTSQQVSWSSPGRSPVQLWARLAEQVTEMAAAGVPMGLAGLYALAGYNTDEATTLCAAGSSTVESLHVEVNLVLPSSTKLNAIRGH